MTLGSGIHLSVVTRWGGWSDYELFQDQYLRVYSIKAQSKEVEKFYPRDEPNPPNESVDFNEEIEGFVDQSRKVIQTQTKLNEAGTRAKIITPFLGRLGWDILGPDVVSEYSEGNVDIDDRVDYGLFDDG